MDHLTAIKKAYIPVTSSINETISLKFKAAPRTKRTALIAKR